MGNSNKARKELKWKPKHNIHTLVKDMVTQEMNRINKL